MANTGSCLTTGIYSSSHNTRDCFGHEMRASNEIRFHSEYNRENSLRRFVIDVRGERHLRTAQLR